MMGDVSRSSEAFYHSATQQHHWSPHPLPLPPTHQNNNVLLNTFASRSPPTINMNGDLGPYTHIPTLPSATIGGNFVPRVQPAIDPASELPLPVMKAEYSFGWGYAENGTATTALAGADRFGSPGGDAGLRRTERIEQHSLFNPLATSPTSHSYGPLVPPPHRGGHQHFSPLNEETLISSRPSHTGHKSPMLALGNVNTLREEISPYSVSPALKPDLSTPPSALKGEPYHVGPGPTAAFVMSGDRPCNPADAHLQSERPFSFALTSTQRALTRSQSKSSQKQLGGYPTALKPHLKYTPSLAALLSNVVDLSTSPPSGAGFTPNSSNAALDGVLKADSASTVIPPSLSLSILASEHLGPEVRIVSMLEPWPSTSRPIAIASSKRKCAAPGKTRYGFATSDVDSAKLDRIINFLLEHSDDTFDCRTYLHNYLAIAPELCFVAFHEDTMVGLVGGVYVDDNRTCAWVGSWSNMGPSNRVDAISRALNKHCWLAIEHFSGPRARCISHSSGRVRNGSEHSQSPTPASPTSLLNSRVLFSLGQDGLEDGNEQACDSGEGTLFVGLGLQHEFATGGGELLSPTEVFVRSAGFEVVEDEPNSAISAWDGLTWKGHLDANEVHQLQIEFECAESLRTLFAVRVPAVSGAIIELDTRLTGLRRSRYLRILARGEDAEVVECWDGAQLVGYSFMLDLKHAYWVAIVMSAHEGGETHTRVIGTRLLLAHFETIVEREARADHLHRKPVTFTCLRGALDLSDGPLPTPATVLLSTSGDIVDGGDAANGGPSCGATIADEPLPPAMSDSTASNVSAIRRFGFGTGMGLGPVALGAAYGNPPDGIGGRSDSGVFAGFDTPATVLTPDPVLAASAAAADRIRAAALSPINVLRRVGLVLPEGELDRPSRRYVRRVGSEPSELEIVPNLWNQCPPPPGLLVVPDLHLPPF